MAERRQIAGHEPIRTIFEEYYRLGKIFLRAQVPTYGVASGLSNRMKSGFAVFSNRFSTMVFGLFLFDFFNFSRATGLKYGLFWPIQFS
jgi:hypothetical protein